MNNSAHYCPSQDWDRHVDQEDRVAIAERMDTLERLALPILAGLVAGNGLGTASEGFLAVRAVKLADALEDAVEQEANDPGSITDPGSDGKPRRTIARPAEAITSPERVELGELRVLLEYTRKLIREARDTINRGTDDAEELRNTLDYIAGLEIEDVADADNAAYWNGDGLDTLTEELLGVAEEESVQQMAEMYASGDPGFDSEKSAESSESGPNTVHQCRTCSRRGVDCPIEPVYPVVDCSQYRPRPNGPTPGPWGAWNPQVTRDIPNEWTISKAGTGKQNDPQRGADIASVFDSSEIPVKQAAANARLIAAAPELLELVERFRTALAPYIIPNFPELADPKKHAQDARDTWDEAGRLLAEITNK